jgi:hypothetical protein
MDEPFVSWVFSTGAEDFGAEVPRRSTGTGALLVLEVSGSDPGYTPIVTGVGCGLGRAVGSGEVLSCARAVANENRRRNKAQAVGRRIVKNS